MSKLLEELQKIDWTGTISASLADPGIAEEIDRNVHRSAIWVNQISLIEPDVPAAAFLIETVVFSQQASALLCCGFYRSCVAAARGIVESALYYTYFRSHPAELATLVRNSSFFLSKGEILDYHKRHTPNFTIYQDKLNFLSDLDRWYSRVSAVAHGQIPGTYANSITLSDTKFDKTMFDDARQNFLMAGDLVHRLFLATLSADVWGQIDPGAKSALVKGLPGDTKELLQLDKK